MLELLAAARGFNIPYDRYQDVSFVNSIATTDGGEDVYHVRKEITRIANKKPKQAVLQRKLWLFINCSMLNAKFSGSPLK